jgi:hypothetical protein
MCFQDSRSSEARFPDKAKGDHKEYPVGVENS